MADSRPAAIDALAAQDILKLLEALPTGYRTVFNLYVLEGYTHREIADLLGISINTSKSQLIQARRKLAAWLHQPSILHVMNQEQHNILPPTPRLQKDLEAWEQPLPDLARELQVDPRAASWSRLATELGHSSARPRIPSDLEKRSYPPSPACGGLVVDPTREYASLWMQSPSMGSRK